MVYSIDFSLQDLPNLEEAIFCQFACYGHGGSEYNALQPTIAFISSLLNE